MNAEMLPRAVLLDDLRKRLAARPAPEPRRADPLRAFLIPIGGSVAGAVLATLGWISLFPELDAPEMLLGLLAGGVSGTLGGLIPAVVSAYLTDARSDSSWKKGALIGLGFGTACSMASLPVLLLLSWTIYC